MCNVRSVLYVLYIVCSLTAVAAAQLLPVDAEFQVNTSQFEGGSFVDSSEPAVGVDAAGNFMVAWHSSAGDTHSGVYGRLYDRTGAPVGDEFQITHDHGYPALAATANSFVVVWNEGQSVFGQRYNSSTGAVQGSVFHVGDEEVDFPEVGCSKTGQCLIVWSSQSSGIYRVNGRQYDSSGTAGFGIEVRSDTIAPYAPHVAVDAAGNFMVVWHRINPDNVAESAVLGQLYTTIGTPLGGPVTIASTGVRYAYDASQLTVAADPSGSFFVAWDSRVNATETHFLPSPGNVFAQEYDGRGAPSGPQVRITNDSTYLGFFPVVTSDGARNFVLAWREINDSDAERLSAQYLGAGSVALGPVFHVTSSNKTTDKVAIASDGNGGAVVAWDSERRIFAQRYQIAPVPTVSPTAIPTPGPPLPACVGDCNGDATVTIDEITTGVAMGLGSVQGNACPSFWCNGSVDIVINCLLVAVNNDLGGCPAP